MNRRDFLRLVGGGVIGAFTGGKGNEDVFHAKGAGKLTQRRLGKTGHKSSVVALGGMAIALISQSEADALIEETMEAGVNHFDMAPSYGDCELRIAHWMKRYRDKLFI